MPVWGKNDWMTGEEQKRKKKRKRKKRKNA